MKPVISHVDYFFLIRTLLHFTYLFIIFRLTYRKSHKACVRNFALVKNQNNH